MFRWPSLFRDRYGCRNWTNYRSLPVGAAWTATCPYLPNLNPNIYCFPAMYNHYFSATFTAPRRWYFIHICIMFFIGMIGTLMVLLVTRSEKKTPMVVLIQLMAVFDSLDLITTCLGQSHLWYVFIPHPVTQAIRSSYFENAYWSKMVYLIPSPVAKWLVVVMTIERFVAVFFPLKVNKVCTIRKTLIAVVCGVSVVIMLNIHHVARYEVIRFCDCCQGMPQVMGVTVRNNNSIWSYSFMYATYIMNMTIFVFIPIPLIVILNVLIIHKVTEAGQFRQQMSTRKDNDSLKILVAISVMFVICETPRMIGNFLSTFTNVLKKGRLATTVSNVGSGFSILNATLNFYLYCLASARFRKKLTNMCSTSRNK